MAKDRRLGKGLDSLLMPDNKDTGLGVMDIDPDQVVPNSAQPRLDLAPEAMEALIESVSRNGILQPIIVRKVGKKFELVAGERRWRAAQHLGLPTVPAVVRDVPDEQMLELALIENIQREDLNPIEKAKAFSRLIRDHNLTQAEAAERVGMDRSSVANFIRLLDLSAEFQGYVSRGTLSMGHARALLGCSSHREQMGLLHRILDDGLSVRALERLVSAGTAKRTRPPRKAKGADVSDLEAKLTNQLGLKVAIRAKSKRSGQLVIGYKSLDELDRVLGLLGAK